VEGTVEDEKLPENQDEKMATGSVNSRLYWDYFSSGNSHLLGIGILVFAFIFNQILFSASEIWLSSWYAIEIPLDFSPHTLIFSQREISLLNMQQNRPILNLKCHKRNLGKTIHPIPFRPVRSQPVKWCIQISPLVL